MFLESLSIVLQVAGILLVILVLRLFYIGIAVFILSLLPNVFKRNLLYKYVVSIDGKEIVVKKEYNAERFVILEKLDIEKDVLSFSIGEKGQRYFEVPTDLLLSVQKTDGREFCVAVDEYFYGVLDYVKNKGKTE